jgi:dTDP-4-amino-4,6-dideoxygalactose transaminase
MSHSPTSASAASTTQAAKPVPFFELATQWQEIRNEVEMAVKAVFETQQFCSGAASGPFVGKFEENLGKYLGGHVVGVSSGTDAILAALMALGIGRGAEVITTPFTFFATAGCVMRSGARAVFVDIEEDTFLLSIPAAEAAITAKTRAILPVHLYGQMLDMGRLAAVAGRHKLDVIEDAAQAIGAKDPAGKQLAEGGRCACLSFYPTKNLGAAGDAGALVTRDAKLAERFKQTRQHGETTRYHHEFVGGNFRMDALQAAVLNVKLQRIEQWNTRRREIAAYYTRRFKGTDVRPPVEQPGTHHVYHQYVVRAAKREALREHLQKNGIGCNVFYPKSLHVQECFAELGYKQGAFPVAERACEEVLALPVYPELTDAQVERVAEVVLGFYR